MGEAVAVDDTLWADGPDGPQLLGAREKATGQIVFPARPGNDRYETVPLAREGTLWTWTVQRFLPGGLYQGPGDARSFVPYAVGYVELPGQVRVEARLTESDPSKLKIGMTMRLVVEAFAKDAEGRDLLTYAFAPV